MNCTTTKGDEYFQKKHAMLFHLVNLKYLDIHLTGEGDCFQCGACHGRSTGDRIGGCRAVLHGDVLPPQVHPQHP